MGFRDEFYRYAVLIMQNDMYFKFEIKTEDSLKKCTYSISSIHEAIKILKN